MFSCSKQQSALICGDHRCVNKAEAKKFFEDNLTIEVEIVSDNKQTIFDLVDLNISGDEQDIKVFKSKKNKVVKKLSKDEIKAVKKQLKESKKKSEKKNKTNNNKNNLKTKKKREISSSYNLNNNSIDICLKLKKCDIDSIANYLIKISNEKDFPNISLRE